jgi:aspartate/methionine/tyrosine aminotransferase
MWKEMFLPELSFEDVTQVTIYARLFAGSYSDSVGIEVIRKDIASYITRRDGIPCDYNDIFMSTGASDGIKVIVFALLL